MQRDYALVIFNASGIQGQCLRKELRNAGLLDVDVWTIDLLPTKIAETDKFHKQCGYQKAIDDLFVQYNKNPIIIIGNPPCTFNSFVCPLNNPLPGKPLPKEDERMLLKKLWMEQTYRLMKIRSPVTMIENPRGYMDKVITQKDRQCAYSIVQPWHFGNLWTKETHIWSAGNESAIMKIPLEKYIHIFDKPQGVVKNWVGKQVDSEARSVTPPGMAAALAKCAVDRYKHCISPATSKKRLELEFHQSMINPPTTKKSCGQRFVAEDGSIQYCNLPIGHAGNERCLKRDASRCGVYDATAKKFLFRDLLLQKRIGNETTMTQPQKAKHLTTAKKKQLIGKKKDLCCSKKTPICKRSATYVLKVSNSISRRFGKGDLEISVSGNDNEELKHKLKCVDMVVKFTKGPDTLRAKTFKSINKAMLEVSPWNTINSYNWLYTQDGRKAKDIRDNGECF